LKTISGGGPIFFGRRATIGRGFATNARTNRDITVTLSQARHCPPTSLPSGGREFGGSFGQVAGHDKRCPTSNKGFLDNSSSEFPPLVNGLVRRKRIEFAGGVSDDVPPVLKPLGVSAAPWERGCAGSAGSARELDLMATMCAEARRRS